MGSSLFMIIEAYTNTWNLCAAFLLFFAAVAVLAHWFRAPRLDFQIAARRTFWTCLIPGFGLLAVCLTLIDKPHFHVSAITNDWLFMFSAFLGVPVAVPLLAGAAWASAHGVQRTPVQASSFALVLLGTFGLACAASNIHDVVWCGVITEGYTRHHPAGYDLDVFVAFGERFGISREILADYATLGPCAAVMVFGELLVAAACFRRLGRMGGKRGDAATVAPSGEQ